MPIKNKLKKIGTTAAFATAGIVSAVADTGNTDKTDTGSNAPIVQQAQRTQKTTIFTVGISKYLVPNEGETLQDYRHRLQTEAQELDKSNQEWEKKNHHFVNTTPVKSVIDLCKTSAAAYVELATKEIMFNNKCSEETALNKLSESDNVWMNFGHMVQKEKKAENAAVKKAQLQGR